MTARGKQWTTRTLPTEEVREHYQFQLRAGGIDRRHLKKLRRELDAGKSLPPIRVAKVGGALYVVDGFHRLEAHRRAGFDTIEAEVARMSLPEAREAAMGANTTHGLNLDRASKQRVWEAFTGAGRHLDAEGHTRSARSIEADLDGVYTRETIRKRLKAMGLELNEGNDFKPWNGGEDDEAALEVERVQEAEECLKAFGAIIPTLAEGDRSRLLAAARGLVDALETGGDGKAEREAVSVGLGF